MPVTKAKATARTAARATQEDNSEWEPIKEERPPKVVRRRCFRVHIAGNESTAQVFDNVTDETHAIAEYVKKNQLVSHVHNFRVVEMRLKDGRRRVIKKKIEE